MSSSMSMYQAAIPGLSQSLNALAGVLAKGEASATERGIDPSVLLGARLAPDMLPLTAQIQIASDTAKRVPSVLSGRETPSWPDVEASFADLQARIAKTVDHLQSFKPEDLDGTEDRKFTIKLGANEVEFVGMPYLIHFAIPNFYFHVATAYGILRENGVPLSKRDFIGKL